MRISYQDRLSELNSKLQHFENKLRLPQIRLFIGQFGKSPECSYSWSEKKIQLPSWTLLKYNDIPLRFRLASFSDVQLTDRSLLREFALWINEKMQEMGLKTLSLPEDYQALELLIRFLKDPESYEKIKDFSLCHELGHQIYCSEVSDAKFQEYLAFSEICVGLLFFLPVGSFPVLVLGSVGFAAVGVSLIALGIFSWIQRKDCPCLSPLEQEKRADLYAVQLLNDSYGGVEYFKATMHYHLALRRASPSMQSKIDPRGNNLLDKDHPPLTDRIAYLSAWRRAGS